MSPSAIACTLAEAIPAAAQRFPGQGFIFQDQHGHETAYDFLAIEQDTARRATLLAAYGLRKGDRVGLVLTLPEEFVLTFLAIVRMGVIPVPMSPPPYLASMGAYSLQIAASLQASGARALIASDNLIELLQPAASRAGIQMVLSVVVLHGLARAFTEWPMITPEDIVFLQFTSGSTAEPKGVVVTHAALIANIHCFMGEALQMAPGRDKGVCWLPLYHDMGLIGFVLGPLYWGVPVVFIPTARFVVNPSVWFNTLHRHRGTVTFGPNFAYALATKKVREPRRHGWDLSCVKALGCGAEPVSANTLRRFLSAFAEVGLNRNALMPAYGLAESTLAVTMKRLHEPLATRQVDKSQFQQYGRAGQPVAGTEILEHVSCGSGFSGHQIAIQDEHGRALDEDREGEICIRGPSVTAGYFGDPVASAAAIREGWLHTGDLGYLHQDQLYVTGRIKDLIILNGRNIHPQTIEWTAGQVDGVRNGSVAAFSRPSGDGEQVIVAVEVKSLDPQRVLADVDYAVRSAHSIPHVKVVYLEPGEMPKTSSGKVRRRHVRELCLSRFGNDVVS